MELEAISGAATIALTSTIAFMLIAKTWNAVSRSVDSSSNFSEQIMHEAAQGFRDELDRMSASQSRYLCGALVFALLFVAAYFLRAQQLFSGYPSWQLYLQLSFLALVIGFAAYCIVRTTHARHQLKFVRDANIAIGHQLRQLPLQDASIFHDVPTKAGIVDHVIVGHSGIYAINVVARRSRKRGDVRLVDHCIEYAGSDDDFSIVEIASKTARLQKELGSMLGRKLRVRSVVAVPGWNVDEQLSETHLLVNEHTLGMLTGWKDNSDLLMSEDAAQVQIELTARCRQT